MTPSPLQRYARSDDDVPAAAQSFNDGGMQVPPFSDLAAWLAEIDRQAGLMRPSRRLYERYDRPPARSRLGASGCATTAFRSPTSSFGSGRPATRAATISTAWTVSGRALSSGC
jgi:hypothetical protein